MIRHQPPSDNGKAGWRLLLHLWMPALIVALLIVTCLSPVFVLAGAPPELPSGPAPTGKGHPKLGSRLNELANRPAPALMGMARSQTMAAPGGETVRVIIEAEPGQAGPVAALARGLGTFEGSYEDLVQATVPVAALTALADNPLVKFVDEPMVPLELAVGEGVPLVKADLWQAASINGTGVKIGILDGGFKDWDIVQAAGELPSSVSVNWSATVGGPGASEHGTACAEIIYDMAPGAAFYFANFSGPVEWANQAQWLIDQGVNIISSSVGWPAGGPLDGTGTFDAVVQTARNAGVLWVQSAGNDAQRHWSGTYTDANSDNYTEFAAADQSITINATAGSRIQVALTWDDPWGASGNDYDLYLYDPVAATFVDFSDNPQNGNDDPYEFLSYPVPSSQSYDIRIYGYNTGAPRVFQLYNYNQDLELVHQVPAGSIVVPADSPAALTVGAVYWNPGDTLETFSSQGPTSDNRTKPDLVAPDGIWSYTYNGTPPYNPIFKGTSASAPYTAGAAALVMQRFPAYSANQTQTFLEGRAIDLGVAGRDNLYGWGRLDLGTAQSLAVSVNGTGTTVPAAGVHYYDTGDFVSLTATPDPNWSFLSWSGNVTTVDNVTMPSTNVTMNGNYAIVANFQRVNGTITTGTSGTGTVTLSPVTANNTYAVGASVNITATPGNGWRFVNWTGGGGDIADVNAESTNITITNDYTLTAVFDQPALTLNKIGSGSVTGAGTYSVNATANITATPAPGWRFVNWTGSGTIGDASANETTIVMDTDRTLTANFDQPTLTINVNGGGNATGAGTYGVNTTANITATPTAGWQFTSWSGNVTTVGNVNAASTNITMDNDYTVTANFEALPAPPPPSGGGGGGAPGLLSLAGRTDNGGYLLIETRAFSADSQIYLTLERGTQVLLDGFPPLSIFVFPLAQGASPPPPPDDMVYGADAYSFGPDGLQFDPPVVVRFKFKTELLPEGVRVSDLSIAWWDEETETWQLLPTTYDEETGYLVAEISHFSVYSVLAALPRPDISVTGISPQNGDVIVGDDVVVNVEVTNAGNAAGDYELTLLQDGGTVESRTVSVEGGDTVTETFTVEGLAIGEYAFEAGDLTTTVTVSPEPTPAIFEVRALKVSPSEIELGQSVNITATVENTGDLGGSLDLNLMVNSELLTMLPVQLDGGETGDFTVRWTFETPGLKIIGAAGRLTVLKVNGEEPIPTPVPQPAETTTTTPIPTETATVPPTTETVTPTPTPTETPAPDAPLSTWMIFAIAGGLLVIAVAAAYIIARRKWGPGGGDQPPSEE